MADNHNRGSSDAFRRRQEARRRREPQTIDAKAQDVTTSSSSDSPEPDPQQSDPVSEAPAEIGALAPASPDRTLPADLDTAVRGADQPVVTPDWLVETGTDRTTAMSDPSSSDDPVLRHEPMADMTHPVDTDDPAPADPVPWSDLKHGSGDPAEPLASGGPVPVSEFIRTAQTEAAEPAQAMDAEPPAATKTPGDSVPGEAGLASGSPVPMSDFVRSPQETETAIDGAFAATEAASAPYPSSGGTDAAFRGAQPVSDPVRSRGSANRFGDTSPVGRPPVDPAAGRDGGRSWLPAALAALAVAIIAGLVGIYYGIRLGNSVELAAKVDALTQRVATLEARPAAPPAAATTSADDLGALQTRSSALDGDVAALKTALADLTAKLEQTTQAASNDSGRIAALEQHAAASSAAPAAVAGQPTLPAVPAPDAPPVPPAPASPPDTAAGDTGPSPAGSAPASAATTEPAGASADLAALTSKVEDLAKRLAALPTEAPVPIDLAPLQGRISDLATRLEAQQAAVAALPKLDEARLDTRLTGLDQKIDDTGRHVAEVGQAVAAIPKLDLAPLQASIAEVDGRLKPVEAALAAPKSGDQATEARAVGSSEESRAAPLAVVAGAVARALNDGRPFEPELDALRGLGIEDAALGPLPVLAGPGAPTAETLRDRWADIQGKVLTAAGPKTGDSVLDRFAAGARTLVQVRQVGTAPGDDPSAASARIGAALDHGDIADALGAWAKLPDASRTASQGWADAARSRLEADASVRALMVRAIAALAPPKN